MLLAFGIVNQVRYKNYKGEVADRKIIPMNLTFGSNEYHAERQWLLHCYDVDRAAIRTYALKDIIVPDPAVTLNIPKKGNPHPASEWGTLPDQPCPRCREKGGVRFRNNESEAGRVEHQECCCAKCAYTWIADTPF